MTLGFRLNPLLAHLATLSIGQGLTGTVVSLLTTVSSLVGAMLAPSPALATVPVTATVVGAAAMVYFVSTIMQRVGRRLAFILGSGIGCIGSLLAAGGIYSESFVLFTAGAFVLGLFTAFNQYYRFAAADAAPSPEYRGRAISYVTFGGILGGFLGPAVANSYSMVIPLSPYLGAFLAVGAICLLAAVLQLTLPSDRPKNERRSTVHPGRTSREIITSPRFAIATLNCAVGFGSMTLLMNATPLAMQICGFALPHTSSVLQWHFVAMYAPSLIGALIISRIGAQGLVLLGIAANVAGVVVAVAGIDFQNFWWALLLFGLGWNFMFNGGTTMLLETYDEREKARAQGLNSLMVYMANVVASLVVGPILFYTGWVVLNIIVLPLLLLSAIITVRSLGKGTRLRGQRLT